MLNSARINHHPSNYETISSDETTHYLHIVREMYSQNPWYSLAAQNDHLPPASRPAGTIEYTSGVERVLINAAKSSICCEATAASMVYTSAHQCGS